MEKEKEGVSQKYKNKLLAKKQIPIHPSIHLTNPNKQNQPLPHLQNLHHSVPLSVSLTLRPDIPRPSLPNLHQKTPIPTAMKPKTTSAWKGLAKMALVKRNRLTQQKQTGVKIQHL